MADSAEHRFVAEQLDSVLNRVARTRLFGITEAQRRIFDYACILFRDFSRPLVSQVLWRHEDGIEKDVRTLLHDNGSLLKVYIIADTVRVRARLDEVLSSYRSNTGTRTLLRGLRLIFLPTDFDADRERDREWMARHIEDSVTRDVLFGVLFGRLNSFEFNVFLGHGGPFGLKYAMLHEITENGLHHMPTFKDRLGYKTGSPIREALTMLMATGLVRKIAGHCCVPTIKGRLLLDLTRVLMFEAQLGVWSDETLLILRHLGVEDVPECRMPEANNDVVGNLIALNLVYAQACGSQFGRELSHVDKDGQTQFYSQFDWRRFVQTASVGSINTARWLADEDSLLFIDEETDPAR